MWKSEQLASFSALFHSKCKCIIYFPHTVYPAMSKTQNNCQIVQQEQTQTF